MSMATSSGGSMNSDINITPFIDVLLVLLVIFMITQPMLRKVLDIQVPLEETVSTPTTSDNIVLEIKSDGGIFINTLPVDKVGLSAKLHEIYDARPDKLLFIKVDNSRTYREVVEVIDVARGAGVKVFGLAPPDAAVAGS